MKKFLWVTAMAVPLALSTQAFGQTPAPATTGTMAPAAGKMGMQPGGEMAPAAAAEVSPADKKFVMKAAIGGMAEVQLAQLAEQKSQDQAVKDFAQHMIDDHTPNNEQLMKLATAQGMTPPTELDSMHQKQMTKLQALDGKKFDRAYLKGQTKDHEAMLKVFQAEQTGGKDAELKAFAEQTIPVIQKHLSMVPSSTM
jgi:putative membrane protein